MSASNRRLSDETGDSTLRDVMSRLFRHKRLAIVVFCGLSLAAVLFAGLWAARYYQASMEILVQSDRTDTAITSSETSPILNNDVVTPDQINSEMALLQGADMLHSVASTCGLDQGWSPSDIFLPWDAKQRKVQKLAKATNHLASALDVEVEKVSDVIDVSYGKTGSPETPACVLKALRNLYLEKHLQLRRPAGSSTFFAHETDQYRQALKEAEARLANFGPEEGIAAPDVVRTNIALALANSVATSHSTDEAISADQQRIKDDELQMAATPQRSLTHQDSNSADVLLQQLQSNLLLAQLKRTQLALKYEPTYPLVKEADQEIASTRQAIAEAQATQYVNKTTDVDPTYELLREDLAKTRADLASRKATAVAVERSIQSMGRQMVDLDQKAVKQASLLREVKADEATYLLYLDKQGQERTSDALDNKGIANVAIAVEPGVPAIPAYNPLLVLLIGLVLAVFTSIGAAYTADYIDPSFQTPAKVFEALNVPVVVSLPNKAA